MLLSDRNDEDLLRNGSAPGCSEFRSLDVGHQ